MSAVQFKHRFSRPAVAEKRLSLTPNGDIRYQLKTPSRDGTTHVIFEPLDFVGRLAALVAKPSVNPTRFHGDFAPNSKHRALVTPAKRGRGGDLLPIGLAGSLVQRVKLVSPSTVSDWRIQLPNGVSVSFTGAVDASVLQQVLNTARLRSWSWCRGVQSAVGRILRLSANGRLRWVQRHRQGNFTDRCGMYGPCPAPVR